METVLSVEHLMISFSQYERGWRKIQLPVIRDLSINVKGHEIVAVVGSSGSGKSLLAHAVMGLLPANASWKGRITFKGEELTGKRVKELRGRQMVLVPQSVSYLDPLMKVGDQVRNGHKDGKSRTRSREVLSRYGLGEDTEGLYPFQLSGGMTRRVLISTAVMEKPELVIADEPTPGLHISAAKRVLSHFREIADEGAGVLLITHDLELALKVADRIVVFYAGTNVEEAAVSDFQREVSLRHPYTRALYRAMPSHGFEVQPGAQPYVKDLPRGCPYGPRCPMADQGCLEEIEYRAYKGGMVKCRKAGI
ncbi:putative dipeptide ABC transporter, ATP-binding protein DppD [Clostridiales bacterium 1_7_47FAA]|nr:putative dipeptide ABC transporter, ATP-binding protein DppD [Clostridiales bacterium 1_7_47FAA]